MAETDKTNTAETEEAETAAKAAKEAAERKSRERFEQIVAKFRERKISDVCPRCSTKAWGIQETSLLVTPPGSKDLHIPPPNIRVILARCQQCGYLAMHSAQTLGL